MVGLFIHKAQNPHAHLYSEKLESFYLSTIVLFVISQNALFVQNFSGFLDRESVNSNHRDVDAEMQHWESGRNTQA